MTAAKTGARTVASDGPHQQLSYHPYLVAFSGRATPATADLLPRVADALAAEFTVGHARGPAPGLFGRHFDLLENDVVLLEGPADSDRPTVLLLDAEGRWDRASMAPVAAPQAPSGAVATVGAGPSITGLPVPHYQPDDVAGLAASIRSHLLSLAGRTPLYGLILAGGASRRMGRHKWALEYHGVPHALYLSRLLAPHCQQVFLSLNAEQQREPVLAGHPHLVDRFLEMGPLGGILTAMTAYPDASWLVLACDLPFVEERTIERLLSQRAPLRFATSYRNPHDGLPEPLFTLYEAKARLRLFQLLALGHARPREMLLNSRIELVTSLVDDELVNANDEVDYQRALGRLRASGQG